uniref:Si:dkey-15h8.17 n=1 Tax=Erpetoichthys calabaricus TaxID=27687 RepID=A0A8C4RPV3_ERPCA
MIQKLPLKIPAHLLINEELNFLIQDIREVVLSILPSLSNESLTSLLERLEELGVESREDLAFVQEKDLEKYIRPIQCRKLPVSTPLIQSSNYPSTSNSSVSSFPHPGRPWYAEFQVNWNRMPAAIQKAVANQTRPSPGDRKDMVKAVVDQMLEHDLNPTRAMCHSVVRRIVREYPKSFADVGKKGDMVGEGCHSLLQQIKTRVEYKNRKNTLARQRRERRSHTNAAGEARGPVDQYGCVTWCPVELPAGETEASLDDMKMQLLKIFSELGMSGAEKAEPLMEKTYILQRRYLNGVPAPHIAQVQKEWPFLFSQRCLFSHFKLLTDISILSKLQEALDNKGSTIIKFCQELSHHSGIKDVLSKFEPEVSVKAACVLLLLMAYFKEPKDAILLQDNDATKHSPLDYTSYYNLNLQYPDDASSTLEFIQRCFLGINPESGSKSKKKHGHINQQVCTLLRKLIDFEWMSM